MIIPIFNVSKYLNNCLDSLLCQTYENIEIIGIDDGSTDDSSDIFSSYLYDKRFKLIANYENQGLPSARNLGLLNATGDYIYFVDSDDWVSPYAIEWLLEIAHRDSVDIVIGGVAKYYDENGCLETPDNHAKVMAEEKIAVDIHSAPVLFNSITSWNKLIRSSFIKDHGLIFKQTPRRYEDLLTYKWYLSGAKVSTSSKVTYFYRQRREDKEESSIMQDVSIDAYSDRILSFVDILTFTLDKNLFQSDVDPLHSKFAMMNLPRALSWIMPKVFAMDSKDANSLLLFVFSLQRLVSYFDKAYVSCLPDKIKAAVRVLQNNDACNALLECKAMYGVVEKKWTLSLPANFPKNTCENETNLNEHELKEQIAIYIALNKKLANRLNNLYNTVSWRVTAPLRWGLNMLRRGK